MRSLALLITFLMLAGVAQAANTGWDPKPDGVHAKSPIIPQFLNQTAVDVLTPTTGSIVHNTTEGANQWYDGAAWVEYAEALQEGADISFNAFTAVFESFSTPNIFYMWGNADSEVSFKNLSTSKIDGSITVLEGGEGLYYISANTSFRADFGAIMTSALFKNNTAIDQVFREMTLGPERLLTFLNISSDGSVTQDVIAITDSSNYTVRFPNFTSTQKALDAVSNLEGIYYHVNEGNGSTGFLIYAEASGINIPQAVRLYGAYDGSNHIVKMQTKNIGLGTYTSMTDNGSDFFDVGALPGSPGDYAFKVFEFPDDKKNFVDSSGKIFLKIKHISPGSTAHDFELDRVVVVDRLNSIVIPNMSVRQLTVGDKITLGYKSNLTDTHFYRNNTQLKVIRVGD